MQYLGDYKEDETVYFIWSTNDADGASVTRTVDGTVSVYKDNGVSQSVAGVTDTEDFDGLTGIHACTIDTSADVFYAIGADYAVVLSAATIDGQTVNAVLAHFSIENRFQEVDAVKISGSSGAADNVEANIGNLDAAVSTRSSHTAANVWSVVTRALTDKAGFSLSTAGIQAIWDKATSGLTVVGSIGKLLVDNINATISSRSSHAASAIWSVATRALTDKADFTISGTKTTLDALNDITAASVWAVGTRTLTSFGTLVADIWDKATSALTTADSIGKLLVDNINAAISSRATPTQVQTKCNDALVAQKLDHLVAVADGDDPVDNSIIAKLAAKGADWSSFDHTTDSQEALADYITAISDLVYEPDASSTIATGTQIANTYAACAVDNGVYWQIADTGAGDGLDVICEFNLATTRRAVEVSINGYFNGFGGPVEIYVYNYVSASWNKLSAGTPGTEMRSRNNDRDYVFSLTVGNTDVVTSPGEVKIRFLTKSPNAGDNLYLDYVAIIAASTGAVLPEAVADAVWKFDIEDVRQSAAGEYFAGHVIKRLEMLGTDVATANTATSFTLTAGIATNDAYNGMLLEVRDESSATRDIEIRRIVDWTSAKVVTVDRAYSFTPVAGDHVHITCGYLEAMRGTDNAALATALADLITRTKGLNAIYDSVALRALEATLTDIKGSGWTNETLKYIKELVDELESGAKPPSKANFSL